MRRSCATSLLVLLPASCGGGGPGSSSAGTSVLAFDFQNDTGPVAAGFVRVPPSAARGVHVISVENPTGKKSNLLPLTVTD